MALIIDMNVDAEAFFGAIAANIESINRTLTAAMEELGIPLRGGHAMHEDIMRLGVGRWGAVFTSSSPGWGSGIDGARFKALTRPRRCRPTRAESFGVSWQPVQERTSPGM